jgi:hypothetical protein
MPLEVDQTNGGAGVQTEAVAPAPVHWLVSSRAEPWFLLSLGLLARLWLAQAVFLNADEALHYLLSLQPSLKLTYQATLSTAHPPLYILLLHYWGSLGSSEFFLRLPSVLAGTAFCWLAFLWLERVTNRAAAVIGLSLLLFSPALIYLSAELRQYSVLLFFCAGALYFLDRALAEDSVRALLLSALALYLALLTHYSALLFALTIAVYALMRLRTVSPRAKFLGVWIASQVAALGMAAVLFKTHVSLLRGRNLPERIADSYLRGSIYHSAQEHVVSFVIKTTIRLFHYLFSQEAVGIAGLLLFVAAIVLLLRRPGRPLEPGQPASSQLAFLLTFPIVVNCAVGLLGLYPFGGSRHNSFLALFVMSGIAIALAHWQWSRKWAKPAGIAAVLLICNLFPSPTGPYIRLKNQRQRQMRAAVDFMRQQAPPGSLIFADDQGGLLLSYYLCHNPVVRLGPPPQHFFEARCGEYQVVSLDSHLWIFRAPTFSSELEALSRRYSLAAGQTIWVFQAGWLVDKEPDLRTEFRKLGCPPTPDFGQNILVCQITLPEHFPTGNANGF